MTTSSYLSNIQNPLTDNHRSRRYSQISHLIYQITVFDEENNTFTYEIMADSYAEATEEAEQLASYDMVNISFMSVEVVG